MYCPKCGAQNENNMLFCTQCGGQLDSNLLNEPEMPLFPNKSSELEQLSPYRAPQASLADNTFIPPGELGEYIGFWYRVLAAIIDAMITGAVVVPINLLLQVGSAVVIRNGDQSAGVAILILGTAISITLKWLYYGLCESSSWQATLGKKALGIKVVGASGQRISFGRASGRYFAKMLSAFILCIGFIMVGLTQRKQGLHDMIVSTFVVRG